MFIPELFLKCINYFFQIIFILSKYETVNIFFIKKSQTFYQITMERILYFISYVHCISINLYTVNSHMLFELFCNHFLEDYCLVHARGQQSFYLRYFSEIRACPQDEKCRVLCRISRDDVPYFFAFFSLPIAKFRKSNYKVYCEKKK